MSTQEMIDSSLDVVVEVFRSHRDELLSHFGSTEFRIKDDKTPVTDLDVALEKNLREALKKAHPELGFYGEESGHHGSTESYWCVDPIDGTSSFIRGLPFATNMAALIQNGVTVASVIYDFLHDAMYTAKKNQGALRNGEQIIIASHRRSHDFAVYALGSQLFQPLQEVVGELHGRAFLPLTASGYSYIQLAEGRIDAVAQIDPGAHLHDVAPGLLLAEEAGCKTFTLDDTEGVDRLRYVVGRPDFIDSLEQSGLL